MAQPSVLPLDRVVYDIELLRELRGRKLSNELEVLCVIGAHRFDELPLVNSLFPALKAIYLFEPQAEPLAVLRQLACSDSRLKVFPFAVSDADGTARFNIASNNGESSSLLQLGTHRSLFPDVSMQSAIEVPTVALAPSRLLSGVPSRSSRTWSTRRCSLASMPSSSGPIVSSTAVTACWTPLPA